MGARTGRRVRGDVDVPGYKIGDSGLIEGKCALCGTYVIKGGVKFREKSVLCPDCAKKRKVADPYHAVAGKR